MKKKRLKVRFSWDKKQRKPAGVRLLECRQAPDAGDQTERSQISSTRKNEGREEISTGPKQTRASGCQSAWTRSAGCQGQNENDNQTDLF